VAVGTTVGGAWVGSGAAVFVAAGLGVRRGPGPGGLQSGGCCAASASESISTHGSTVGSGMAVLVVSPAYAVRRGPPAAVLAAKTATNMPSASMTLPARINLLGKLPPLNCVRAMRTSCPQCAVVGANDSRIDQLNQQ
jgi:hypothetical protein